MKVIIYLFSLILGTSSFASYKTYFLHEWHKNLILDTNLYWYLDGQGTNIEGRPITGKIEIDVKKDVIVKLDTSNNLSRLELTNEAKERFKNFGGYSSQPKLIISNTTALTSIAFGGCIIEKHFTLDRSGGGPDDTFSLEPSELNDLCINSKIAWNAIGEINYSLKEAEVPNIKFRRSLYFINDIKKGEKVTDSDIASVRPGYGIPPKNFDLIIGKRVNKDVLKNTAVKFSDISNS